MSERSEDTQVRATCWSVTWYPPTDSLDREVSQREIEAYAQRVLLPGWYIPKDGGQMEQCPTTGRYHYQAMLRTPQVRKSAVIAAMDKAHIERAVHSAKLANYVQKAETRVASIASAEPLLTIFTYQAIIADMYNEEECKAYVQRRMELTEWKEQYGEAFLKYIDTLVSKDIRNGRKGVEYVAFNPMWRAAWKLFGPDIIFRHNIQKDAKVLSQGQEGNEEEISEEERYGS